MRLLEVFSAYQGHRNDSEKLDWSPFFKYRKKLGGESYDDVQNRIISFWNEVIVKDEGNVIICSHGDPLFLLYLYLTDKPMPDESVELGGGKFKEYLAKGSALPIFTNN